MRKEHHHSDSPPGLVAAQIETDLDEQPVNDVEELPLVLDDDRAPLGRGGKLVEKHILARVGTGVELHQRDSYRSYAGGGRFREMLDQARGFDEPLHTRAHHVE
jgi:hypothetical protein